MLLFQTLPLLVLLTLPACADAEPAKAGGPAATVEATPVTATPAAAFDHEHKAWTTILAKHVQGDTFDYKALKENRAGLDAYLKTLQAVTPTELKRWEKEQRFAFWINVYNAYTIEKVVDNYPLDSIKDLSRAFGLKSVFDDEFIDMKAHHPDGKNDRLSLNDVEHGILRVRFKDARLHAAVNCASFSCPPLLNEAFVASKLDKQLEAQMRTFIVDPKRNRFDRQKNEVRISEIFKWFEEDFERDAETVRGYLIRFSPKEDAEFLAKAKIRYIDYDWDLNDVKR